MAVSMHSFLPSFALEVRGRVPPYFLQLALSKRCHPFPRWLQTEEGSVVPAADEALERSCATHEHQSRVLASDVLPILLPWHLAAPAAGSYRVYSGPRGMKQSQSGDTPTVSPAVGAGSSLRAHPGVQSRAACTAGKGSAWESPYALSFSETKVLRYHLKKSEN